MSDATLYVRVKPGARAPGLVCAEDGSIEIRVRERAVRGEATEAAGAALAAALGVASRNVELLRGMTSRFKAFRVRGMSMDEARVRLREGGVASGHGRNR